MEFSEAVPQSIEEKTCSATSTDDEACDGNEWTQIEHPTEHSPLEKNTTTRLAQTVLTEEETKALDDALSELPLSANAKASVRQRVDKCFEQFHENINLVMREAYQAPEAEPTPSSGLDTDGSPTDGNTTSVGAGSPPRVLYVHSKEADPRSPRPSRDDDDFIAECEGASDNAVFVQFASVHAAGHPGTVKRGTPVKQPAKPSVARRAAQRAMNGLQRVASVLSSLCRRMANWFRGLFQPILLRLMHRSVAISVQHHTLASIQQRHAQCKLEPGSTML